MGLDMNLYSVDANDARGDFDYSPDSEKVEIAYWRKHHDLHGLMESIYWKKRGMSIGKLTQDEQFEFNCIPLRLTEDDIHMVMATIKNGSLPPTTGFFFGNNPPDDESCKYDLEFFNRALIEIEQGRVIYYNSWW